MKSLVIALACLPLFASAQNVDLTKISAIKPSPADIVYYPRAAPFDTTGKIKPAIRLVYSKPQKKGREIFGKLVPYGKVWRAGANMETEIKFFQPVTLGGSTIPAGTYSLFIVPTQTEWTVIINKQTDRWGAYFYDKTLDVARTSVPIQPLNTSLEFYTMALNPATGGATGGATLIIAWDKASAEVPITF